MGAQAPFFMSICMPFKIHVIDVQNTLKNYIWLIEDTSTKEVVIIDPTESQIVEDYCLKWYLKPKQIWLTHWHKDHVGGVPQLLQKYNLDVYAPYSKAHPLPFECTYIYDGDTINFNQLDAEVLHTPGHTLEHIIYSIASLKSLFVGDVLFAMGCGRVFEGTYQQMYESLQRIKQFDDQTKIYCTHEYTFSNAKFALHVDPDNFLLQERADHVEHLDFLQQNTLPTTLGLEKQTNPFLMAEDVATFKKLRLLKDSF